LNLFVNKQRMDILLIGYEEGENLGLRSIKSFLGKNGIVVQIEPYSSGKRDRILEVCLNFKPFIIGFSLIFQRFLPDFADLINHLRENGVRGHFTMGGHYPGVESLQVMELIPGLDSVVRCEGEYTTLELFHALKNGAHLSGVKGITYRDGATVRVNEPRALIKNLDALPFPDREKCAYTLSGMGLSTIISSRGCFYDCSFCSIRRFYREADGKLRRARSPVNLVDEMELLYTKLGTRIFIFEDDDFYARNKLQNRWADEFLGELSRRNLDSLIAWRMSCRIDDIDEEMLPRMIRAGLMCVYIGIEAGNDISLRVYNKKYTVEQVKRSIAVLEKLRLYYEYGFMLLNPYCTLETIRDDIQFLKEISVSGLAMAHFTKMIPYAGTPVEARLKEEGRLIGAPVNPDYRYLDPKIELLEHFFHEAFSYRNFNTDGLVEKLRHMKLCISLWNRFYPEVLDRNNCAEKVEGFIRRANDEFLEKASMAVTLISENDEDRVVKAWPLLVKYIRETRQFEQTLSHEIDSWYLRMEQMVKSFRTTVPSLTG